MIIVNGFQPLTIITKRSILDVAAVLDPPLNIAFKSRLFMVTIYNSNFLIFMGHMQCQNLFNKLIHLAKRITFLFLMK